MTAGWFVSVAHGVYAAADRIGKLRTAEPLPSDRQTADRLPGWRRAEHLAARALLRRLLAELVSRDAAVAPLAANPHGRPYLVDRPDLAVSLSHTDGWVAAALSTGSRPVGVDAQAPRPASEALLRRCCTALDRAGLAQLPPASRDLELAWIWSVQESCVKALGTGLAGRPWTIPVAPGQRTGRWRRLRWTALRARYPIPVSCTYQEPEEAPRWPAG